MKTLLKTTWGKWLISGIALLVIVMGALGGYTLWHYLQPKFQNVTVELGAPMPALENFLTTYADLQKAKLLTPETEIDMTQPGALQLQFAHGWKRETATLTITDTVAPQVTFQDVTSDVGVALDPKDFVAQVVDHSQTRIDFAQQPVLPEHYGDATVEVVVTDASGNATTGTCKVFYVWLRKNVTMEVGQVLEKSDLLMNPERDAALLDQSVLDQINASGVGTYTVTCVDGDVTAECIVTVQDTIAPALELRTVQIDRYETVRLNDFVVNATDAAGEVKLELVTKVSNTAVGAHTVTIRATDINGNVTTMDTTLVVHKDSKAPTISGADSLTIEKHTQLDFTQGVSAWDHQDGQVEFTVDSSRVKLDTAGTYYAIYTATDSAGNTATVRRKIVVNHDAEDTAALVASLAANIKPDVEILRNYVRANIGYTSEWGGDDPVWYGFKNKSGNCYVHALCLDALLREKGFETQLIWVTDKSHYWNLVKINGEWKHIDSTPGEAHSHYSIMNDEQRYETLNWYRERDWDRTAWPECP